MKVKIEPRAIPVASGYFPIRSGLQTRIIGNCSYVWPHVKHGGRKKLALIKAPLSQFI
jgi:hypothetical protein